MCSTCHDSSNDGLPNCILLACLDNFLPTEFILHVAGLGFAF